MSAVEALANGGRTRAHQAQRGGSVIKSVWRNGSASVSKSEGRGSIPCTGANPARGRVIPRNLPVGTSPAASSPPAAGAFSALWPMLRSLRRPSRADGGCCPEGCTPRGMAQSAAGCSSDGRRGIRTGRAGIATRSLTRNRRHSASRASGGKPDLAALDHQSEAAA